MEKGIGLCVCYDLGVELVGSREGSGGLCWYFRVFLLMKEVLWEELGVEDGGILIMRKRI